MIEISKDILEYPGKSYEWFCIHHGFLNKKQRELLLRSVIKSDYLIDKLDANFKFTGDEKDLIIDQIINKQNFKLAENFKLYHALNNDQIAKLDSLLIFKYFI